MSPALTPVLALDYLREMSADITGGVILDGGGERLSGDEALGAAARELLAGMGTAHQAHGVARAGAVAAARSGNFSIVLACRATAMLGLLQHDLRLVLGDLGAPETPVSAPFQVPRRLVERLLSAAGGRPVE